MLVILALAGCSNGNSQIDPGMGSPGPTPTSTSAVKITNLDMLPASTRPGQSATLTVTATTTGAGALTYAWHATLGTLSSPASSSTAWTAPIAEGTYRVSVDASDGTDIARAYVSIVVATAGTGPLVMGVIPAEAHTGDSVHILGSGFGSAQGSSVLSIGGTTATSITSWTDTTIEARVPSQAITGDVKVTVGGIDSNLGYLVVLWNSNNPNNVAATKAVNSQLAAQLVSDSTGGAIIVWEDYRSGSGDIYAQRIDSTGVVRWTTDGVPVSTAAGNQLSPQLVGDGSGGAIIVWEDYRGGSGDIYAQRIDSAGTAQWAANGVLVSGAAGNQRLPQIVSDGAGGAIMAWEDYRSGSNTDIYAQRVDASGAMTWSADGVVLANESHDQFSPKLVSDTANGAVVAWEDFRNAGDYDIYAQRIDGSGAVQWTANGISACNVASNQLLTAMVADGAGGAILAWEDYRNGNADVYAQRINSGGTMAWTLNGVTVTNAANSQVSPKITSASGNGAILVWEDYRDGAANIYSQRLNGSGVAQWLANGVVISQATNTKHAPQIASDDAGGAIIAWENDGTFSQGDIYAQRINESGVLTWGTKGAAINNARKNQTSPQIVGDGAGGAVIVWTDYRAGNADIYAQGISAGGNQ